MDTISGDSVSDIAQVNELSRGILETIAESVTQPLMDQITCTFPPAPWDPDLPHPSHGGSTSTTAQALIENEALPQDLGSISSPPRSINQHSITTNSDIQEVDMQTPIADDQIVTTSTMPLPGHASIQVIGSEVSFPSPGSIVGNESVDIIQQISMSGKREGSSSDNPPAVVDHQMTTDDNSQSVYIQIQDTPLQEYTMQSSGNDKIQRRDLEVGSQAVTSDRSESSISTSEKEVIHHLQTIPLSEASKQCFEAILRMTTPAISNEPTTVIPEPSNPAIEMDTHSLADIIALKRGQEERTEVVGQTTQGQEEDVSTLLDQVQEAIVRAQNQQQLPNSSEEESVVLVDQQNAELLNAIANVVEPPPVVTNTAPGTTLNQPIAIPQLSHPGASIEAVLEMLLETAKSLTGMVNLGQQDGVVQPEVEKEKEREKKTSMNDRSAEKSMNVSIGASASSSIRVNERNVTLSISGRKQQISSNQNQVLVSSEQDKEERDKQEPLHPATAEVKRLLDSLLSKEASASVATESGIGSSSSSQETPKKKAATSPCASGGGTSTSTSKIHKCPECNKYFPRMNSLQRHLLLHMDERPFQCTECEANYKSYSQLKRHMRLHTGEKPAKCEFCDKEFRTYNELYVHRRIHTGEKPFECKHCGKCFSTRGYRNTHERIHTGEKRFECEFCGMKFTDTSARRVHRFTHTGETPYKCEECGKGFTQTGNLNKHLKTVHAKEKTFKCKDCDKTFGVKQELQRHYSRVHSTNKPHKCNLCEKCYAIPSDLTQHMQTHLLRCEGCGKKFKDADHLENHVIQGCAVVGSRLKPTAKIGRRVQEKPRHSRETAMEGSSKDDGETEPAVVGKSIPRRRKRKSKSTEEEEDLEPTIVPPPVQTPPRKKRKVVESSPTKRKQRSPSSKAATSRSEKGLPDSNTARRKSVPGDGSTYSKAVTSRKSKGRPLLPSKPQVPAASKDAYPTRASTKKNKSQVSAVSDVETSNEDSAHVVALNDPGKEVEASLNEDSTPVVAMNSPGKEVEVSLNEDSIALNSPGKAVEATLNEDSTHAVALNSPEASLNDVLGKDVETALSAPIIASDNPGKEVETSLNDVPGKEVETSLNDVPGKEVETSLHDVPGKEVETALNEDSTPVALNNPGKEVEISLHDDSTHMNCSQNETDEMEKIEIITHICESDNAHKESLEAPSSTGEGRKEKKKRNLLKCEVCGKFYTGHHAHYEVYIQGEES